MTETDERLDGRGRAVRGGAGHGTAGLGRVYV